MRSFALCLVLLGCSSGATADIEPEDSGVAAQDTATVSETAETSATDTMMTDVPIDTTVSDSTTTMMDVATDAARPCTEAGSKTLGGHCYFALEKKSFDAAKSACAAAGAHLVTITSEEEHTLVGTFAATTDRWIGLERPFTAPSTAESFKWITGEAVTIQKWGVLEPRNRGPCGSMNNTGMWADLECVKVITPICERD
jgi:hypothetical protein